MINIEVTVYIDVLFMINFIFDLLGIYLTALIIDIRKGIIRYVCATLISTTVDIMVYIGGLADRVLYFIVIYSMLEIILILVVFGKQRLKKYIVLIGLHFGIMFTVGGMVTAILDKFMHLKKSKINVIELIIIGILVVVLIKYLMPYIIKGIYYRERIYKVTIIIKGVQIETKGLLDTGNNLLEPSTKKQVTIVEKEVMKGFNNVPIDKIFIIPYMSLGKENGVLYGIQVDELIIAHQRFEQRTKEAIIGIYNGKLSYDNRFRAILHSECLM